MLHLLAGVDPNVPLTKENGHLNEDVNHWMIFKKLLRMPTVLLEELTSLIKKIEEDEIPAFNLEAARMIVNQEWFTKENLGKKYSVFGRFGKFMINIVKYFDVEVEL